MAVERPETDEERKIRERKMDPQPPAGLPLWVIDPEPTRSGHKAPETEVE